MIQIKKEEEWNSLFLDKDKLIIVDFYAPWCGPCRTQGDILETFTSSELGNAEIAKINVDDCDSFIDKYNIRSIPTLFFMKDNMILDKCVGLQSKNELLRRIKDNGRK